MHRMFLGPDGVRPIWRLVAAVALYNLLVFVDRGAARDRSGDLGVDANPRREAC